MMQELDAHLLEFPVDVRIVDDLAHEQEPAVGELVAGLVRVVHRAVDAIAEAEFARQPESERPHRQRVVPGAQQVHEPAVVVGAPLLLDGALEAEALPEIRAVHALTYTGIGSRSRQRCRGNVGFAADRVRRRGHSGEAPGQDHGRPPARENHPTKRPASSPSSVEVIATAPESLLSVNRLDWFASRNAIVDPGERWTAVSDAMNRPGPSFTVRTTMPTPVSPEKPSSVSRPRGGAPCCPERQLEAAAAQGGIQAGPLRAQISLTPGLAGRRHCSDHEPCCHLRDPHRTAVRMTSNRKDAELPGVSRWVNARLKSNRMMPVRKSLL